MRYSSREKCLRLVTDRPLDKSYSSRSKALFHSNGDAGLISDESPRLEGLPPTGVAAGVAGRGRRGVLLEAAGEVCLVVEAHGGSHLSGPDALEQQAAGRVDPAPDQVS